MSGARKTAIVTGASQGIGAGIVKGFVERGWSVVANSRKVTQSTEVAASERVALVDGHIGEPATAAMVVETALSRFQSIDALANNAGIFFTKPFTDYTAEDFQSLVSTNLEGFLLSATLALRAVFMMPPVSDVDRAKRLYEKLGFRLDIDYAANENYRIIQFTPPGSAASIVFGKGVTSAKPGSIDGLVLAVSDIDAARGELRAHGLEVSEVFHDAGGGLGGGFHAGAESRVPGPDPQGRSYGSYASFRDPDGNGWLLQEIKERLPGRTTPQPRDGKMTDILLEALKSAAAAHGVHEKKLGRPDPDWPQWYAEHMTRSLGGAGYCLSGTSA